ncbi:MAG TPA: hypothetical protein DD619_03785 [Alphaproteobacteria bacterium]|nr:hypothetical protein [Alphaproteobacteria bacterium]
MRDFGEKFINAYVKMKATEDNENVSLDEKLSAMEYCFDGSKDGSKVVEFELLMLNDTKLRRNVYIKIREEKRKLESANKIKSFKEDKITEQPLTNNSAASKNPYAPYSLQEAAELYDGLKDALEIDKEFVTELYNSGYNLSKYSYNNESRLEQLNEAAWMHQANPEFVDSFLEKNKIQISEFYSVSDVIGQALNLGDEDRQCFEKLAANIDIKEFYYRFQDEKNGNLQELVKIARHDFKMTAALLKFGARDFTNDDINKAVYSDYKNKASIYRLIKAFDENVDEKYKDYLITAVTKFSVEEREKMVKNVAAYKGKEKDLEDYLSKNEKLVMMKNNKEQYRKQLIQDEEKQKQESLEARREEMKEEELDRRINKIASDKYNSIKKREKYKKWLESEGLGLYTEEEILARVKEERRQEERRQEERRKDAALQKKFNDMMAEHW